MKKVKVIGGICVVSILIAALCIPFGGADVAEAEKAGKTAHAGVPEPNDFLGVELGADYTLVDYEQLVSYYDELAAASSRVSSLEYVGESAYGAPMYLIAVSSPENLARLDTITANQKLLAEGDLDDVVLYFPPTNNPDGHDIVTHWYWDTLGEPWEGTSRVVVPTHSEWLF